MRKNILVAGLAVAALLPSLAMAQETCEQRSANRTAARLSASRVADLYLSRRLSTMRAA